MSPFHIANALSLCFFLRFIPFILSSHYNSFALPPSLPVVNNSALSSVVGSRRIAATHAAKRSQQLVDPSFLHVCEYIQNITTVGMELKDQRLSMVLFAGNRWTTGAIGRDEP